MRTIIVFWAMAVAIVMPSSMVYGSQSDGDTVEFAIFTLADQDVSVFEAVSLDLNELRLSDRRFLDTSDIISYSWQDHSLTVTDNVLEKLRPLANLVPGVLFVVTVDGNRIYLGAFWSMLSSMAVPPVPHIMIPPIDSTLELMMLRVTDHEIVEAKGEDDPRSDTRVYQALKAAGILRE